MFPLLFVLFFLSTMNLPAEFIEKSWFRTIAECEPDQLPDRRHALADPVELGLG